MTKEVVEPGVVQCRTTFPASYKSHPFADKSGTEVLPVEVAVTSGNQCTTPTTTEDINEFAKNF